MYSPYQIPRPNNWQDFETLCWALWRVEWKTSSLKKNGRNGQNQNGVDICGRPSDGTVYRGIQCKCKLDDKKLTLDEIKDEVNHAKAFEPKIDNLVIATTYDNDAKLEKEVRKLSEKNVKEKLFTVDIFGWQDIEALLERHTDVRDWYLNLSQIKNQSCTLSSPAKLLTPQYVKKVYSSHYKPEKKAGSSEITVKSFSEKIYGNRCRVGFVLLNTCDYSMTDVVIKCWAENGVKFHRKDKEITHSVFILDPQDPLYVNDDYVSYKANIIHPTDNKYFECFVEIPHGIYSIDLLFKITAKDFVDEQHVLFDVQPMYTEEECPNNKNYSDTVLYEPLITRK